MSTVRFWVGNKNVVRTLKDSDKQRAEQSDSVVTVCYDLQKILNNPQSEVSVFYYKRKLACYNFTMYDLGEHKIYCYLWDETIGRKGSNEKVVLYSTLFKPRFRKGTRSLIFILIAALVRIKIEQYSQCMHMLVQNSV